MPTNRNNEVGKSFDIGTKIEYNGDLYEVTESNSCCDCSLASICSSNDKSSNIKGDLLREERIKIFGECSSLRRPDSKSVVFVEVSTTKEPKVYNTVLYEIDYSHKYITIDIPKGFIIDTEDSDLSKGIIKFKNKWLSLEQLYKSAKDNNYHTCFSEIKDSIGDKTCEVREKLIALANLMDIARYFNGDWKYDIAKEENIGYMIVYDGSIEELNYTIHKIESCSNIYYGNVIFKNKADAQYVIDNPNFREVLDNIFKV